MKIGSADSATTSISTADAKSITVRDRDLCGELMGSLSFTEYFFLLTTGKEPTEVQRFFLDVLLVAIAEHGLVPTNQVARMTYDADPGVLQASVAAGLLGCGSVVLGTTENCGRFLLELETEARDAGQPIDEYVPYKVARLISERAHIPGFGHPLHRPTDPRTEKILELVAQRKVEGNYVALAKKVDAAVRSAREKPLPMNVSMAIAAVLLDLDFPRSILKAIPLLARTASLLAHLAEESETPIGFLMAHAAEEAIAYVPQEGENG